MRDVLGNHLKDRSFRLVHWLSITPISAKDQSRIHQFGKKVLPVLFLGNALYAGWMWKGDILVAGHWGVGNDGRIWNLLEKTQCKRGDISQRKRRIYFSSRRWTNVCGSMSNVDRTRTRMQQLQQSQQLQQPEGWRFVPDTILLGYQWAPQWVPARTPTVHWGPISGKAVGGPNTVQRSSTEQKHGKHGSGAMSIAVKLTIQNRVVKVLSRTREVGPIQEVQDYTCKMSKKSKREQQQKWLRTSHSCTTSWLLVVTQKSKLDRS